ncbi:MAG: undecaprenyl-diphosphate phosphatase, partial [Steroidobacteraceae bacterium]
MDLLQAIILGIIEGVTEFLPVSSTGHLLIAQRLMGIPESEVANAYAIAIQAGAIVAVLGLYRQRVGQMLQGVVGRSADGLRLTMLLLLAFLPAALFGVLFDDAIEKRLFGVQPVIAAWIVGGIIILALAPWIARRREGRSLEQLLWQGALLIGFAQCLALWPGTSRSLVAILGGLLAGLSLSAAVEFAFLLGLITLGAATAYKSVQLGELMVETYGITVL